MKRIFLVLLCLSLLLSILPVSAAQLPEEKPATKGSYPVPAFRAQPVWDKHKNGIPLVVAHKGDWRNFPENSLLGINSCINMGVDIVEVDFHVTKDGVPVLLHDTNLRRVTDADTLVYIADVTWAQAKKYSLEDGQGNKGTNYILTAADAKVLNSIPTYVSTVGTAKAGGTMPIARFDSVLELVNKRAFLLMDKITDANTFAYAYVCTKEWDMEDYVIFKNNYTVEVMETWYAAAAKLWNQKHSSQPITAQEVKEKTLYEFNSTNLTNMQAHINSGVNIAFCSTGITADNVARVRDTVVPFCKKNGIAVRVNTGEGLGDTAKTDSEIGWAEVLKVGVTEIMSDHPGELISYLQQVYGTRAASDRIEGEHFTDYNQNNFGFTVPLEYNSGKNKFVTNLTSKDTLIYENIEFDGTENILTAKAMGTNAKITVYIDGTTATNKVGTLSYNSTSYASAQVKITPISAGKHTVYLKFSGTVGLDQFRFTRGLYFGFSNETLARFRYQDRVYGCTNFDTGNWMARSATMNAASLNNTAGTLSASLTAGGNHYIQTGVGASSRPLHYIPQKGDYFQIRLKISNAVANDAASDINIGVVFSGTGCGDFDYSERVVQKISTSQLNGQYFTLTMAMNSAFTNATEITALRLYFMNLTSASGKTATITIDQVYIGPKAHLPQQEYLYFDFTDRDTDEMRYMTSLYGYQNFDNRQWTARSATMRGAWFEHGASSLLARVTTGGNHYLHSGTSVSELPLRYIPSSNDYLQMVLRIDNGTLYDPAIPLSVGISYAGTQKEAFFYDAKLLQDFPATVIDSGYFTVTVPMPDYFAKETDVQALRIYIRNLAPKNGEAIITVDSLYLGPKTSLPKALYTVTFENEDGTVLETQQVAKGGTVSYSASTPIKPYDKDAHYTFAGWDKPLTNITADTKVTARYTATAHTYTYTPGSDEEHECICSCGYMSSVSHSWSEGQITTEPSCTTEGTKTYTCTLCNSVKAESITATGHSYVYTSLNPLAHKITCENCDLSEEAPHDYVDGVCICKEQESKEPMEDSSLKLGHTLNLASDISINYAVSKTLLKGFDMSTVYAECTLEIYEGNSKTETTTIRIDPVENGNYYYFTLTGLTAIQMNDQITTILYGVKDGKPYYSPADEYSITTYAYSQLNNASRPKDLKILCADLLRYGANAQLFKSYRTDALADSAMTEEHKVYLSNADRLVFGNTNTTLSDLEDPQITWVGKSLNLETKVAVKYIISTLNYSDSLSDLNLRITYTDLYGEKKEAIVTELEEYDIKESRYAFSFNGLLAAELRTVLSAQVYVGDTPVSVTMNYSPDTYGNNKTGALGSLCTALIAYSDSAKAYFIG